MCSSDLDADIVLFDPKKKHVITQETQHMRCDYSSYEGWEVTGKVRTVFLRGNLAIDQGKAFIGKGFGKFIPRKPFSQSNPF